jgi:hypothetical protein
MVHISPPLPDSDSATLRRVIILSPAPSPTLHYYLRNVTDRAPQADIQILNASLPCTSPLHLEAGTWAVIFRHAHPSWLDELHRQSEKLTRATWFIDDNIPEVTKERTLPRVYAWKTFGRYLRIKRRLQKLVTDAAFSTPELAARHAATTSSVWPPLPTGETPTNTPLLYFYHGTAAHRAELEWLAPVIAEVQEQVPEAWFEVFADRRSRKLFRSIPRVRCLYPMSWPDFLGHTSSFRADLGLAPLLDTPFNRSRAPVKFFDITRTGAAGIYSQGPTFGGVVRNGVNGLILPNDPREWAAAIVRLLRTPTERQSLAAQAQQYCSSQQR